MGKTVRLRGYLSKGWGSAVKSAKTDPSPTKAEYNSWVKRPSHKYGSWWTAPGRKDMLYYILARTIQFLNQNTMKKIEEYYKKGMKSQGGMNIYSTRVWRKYFKLDWVKKLRFLERANYLFNESKKFAASGQNSIYAYYNTKTKNIKTAAAQEVRTKRNFLTQSKLPVQFSSYHEQCSYGEMVRDQCYQISF